jgi:hypothetical protein
MDIEPEKTETRGVEFFIGELQSMHDEYEKDRRFFDSIVKRVQTLEGKQKPAEDDLQRMLGTLFIVCAVVQLIPIVIDLVRSLSCRKSGESLSLSQ